jgi:histone H3/H4
MPAIRLANNPAVVTHGRGKSAGSKGSTWGGKGSLSIGGKGKQVSRPHASGKGKSAYVALPRNMGKKAPPPIHKPRRRKVGEVSLRDIRKYQKSTELLIRKLPFARTVREYAEPYCTPTSFPNGLRWESGAMTALQEGSEAYLVSVFQDANICAFHGKRITLMEKDLRVALHVRGEKRIANYTG